MGDQKPAAAAAARLRAALEMHDDGIEIMRNNLRRRNPSASDAEIVDRLQRWLRQEAAAE